MKVIDNFEEKRRKAIQELLKGSTKEEQRKISKGLREGKKLRKIAEKL